MIAVLPWALVACWPLASEAERITAGDLARAVAAFASVPAETPLAPAPEAAIPRVLRASELRRLAARWEIGPVPETDVCFTRRVAPLDRPRLLAALREQLPEARIELLDFSRQPVPEGTLVFPPAGLPRSAAAVTWNGYVRYGGARRFPVWAQVKVGMPPPAVERGDTVRVNLWSGAAHLSFEARAETAGSVGQRVRVWNPATRRRFLARVDGSKRVSVWEPAR